MSGCKNFIQRILVSLYCVTDIARKQVAFHVTDPQSHNLPADTPIKFASFHYNLGNAYSYSTGYFVAPYRGYYYFICTTGSNDLNDYALHSLYVDNRMLGVTATYDVSHPTFAPVHAVVHLVPGQKVWVKADGSSYANNYYSMFSGFLLALDP
jgi:hypothetical protein